MRLGTAKRRKTAPDRARPSAETVSNVAFFAGAVAFVLLVSACVVALS